MILLLLGTKSGCLWGRREKILRIQLTVSTTMYSCNSYSKTSNKSIDVASIYASAINGIMEAWTLGCLKRKSVWFTHY